MKIDLAVIGQGAVSPAGMGPGVLLGEQPAPVPVAFASQPDQTWPVRRVDLKAPAFNRWLKEPRLRRTSPITLFMVEAAEQALAGLSVEDRRATGLVAAFSAGCLAYTHRFFEGILRQGQKTASPALFPETVFNSPMSHVASVLGLNGAAYALVGDEAAWVAALKTAAVWLRQDRVKQVLILGAEEFDPLVLDAYRSSRWLRDGFLPSEGAAALLVRSRHPESDSAPPITVARDGFIYRSKREAALAAEHLFVDFDSSAICYPSAEKTWVASLEKNTLRDRAQVPVEHRPYLGAAFTASAGWHTQRALATNPSRLFLPVWGLNHQSALLELDKET